jgi:hypothetical protein
MGLIQNLLLQSIFLGHNQSLFEPQGPFRILMETSDLQVTFFHSSLDMTPPSLFFRASMISSLNIGVRVMLSNDKSGNMQVLDSSPIHA